MQEIESKFLVTQEAFLAELVKGDWDYHDIEQGYLFQKEGVVLRIRGVKSEEGVSSFYLTLKAPLPERSSQVASNHEFEFEISERDYLKYIEGCTCILRKTRFTKRYDGKLVEVDLFEGLLDGLVLAEVEFESLDESLMFEPLPFFGKNVSSDPKYSNAYLAGIAGCWESRSED